ncbi:hypothetical protein [Sphingomonas sp.]|jgi:hypothetical protein|uniref:hypothetical protein n=1 Tax=Sphingomonas sp. TaxID=28214 RepID=UPI002E315FC0|nr:hypothetical protein [Sphingomonas sp.]HEX4695716.1 hypothetical protein [Sphingomonas sp.]
MSALEDRGAAIGEAARERTVARLAARLSEEVPHAAVVSDDQGVTVSGRGILRDPRLVWIGSLLK